MPLFQYTARNKEGKSLKGYKDAPDQIVAVSLLQAEGLIITRIKQESAPGSKSLGPLKSKPSHNKIKGEDLLFFMDHTASLLESGIPLLKCLDIVSGLVDSQKLRVVLGEIIGNIQSGSTLKDSLARHPKDFPAYWSFVIEAGESSGTLPTVLVELAKNLEATLSLQRKITSALIYPLILIGGSICAILFFILHIIPIFKKLFDSFNAELPALTKALIAASSFAQHYVLFIAIGLAALIYFFRQFAATPYGRMRIESILLVTPIFSGLIKDVVHARMCTTLAMLIKSGLNLLTCLEITSRATGNSVYEAAFKDVISNTQQGKTLSYSLSMNPIFSPMMTQLVMVGEESGQLPKMIDKSASYYRARVDLVAGRIGVLIEPIVLIIVGGFIGVLVVSMFLPLIQLSTAIK